MVGDQWLGAELAGYRIDALIGQGGMGVVYRATHLQLHRQAALKLLAASLAVDAEYRHRFEREARLAASLEHPHIVPIYDAGYTQDVLYLAMRYIDGPNLATMIDNDGPMDLSRVCELLGGIAEALDTAHDAGLVHRDVKPANILIAAPDRPGQQQRPYLCDFGIAKHTAASSAVTSTGQFLGTLRYCAPEQIQGQPLDGRADQYALACVAFHCLTGQVPFPAEEPSAVMFAHLYVDPPSASAQCNTLPATIDDVFARALAKQPTQRFPDCTTFLQALRAAANTTITAPRPALASPSLFMLHRLRLPPTPIGGDSQEKTRRKDENTTTARASEHTVVTNLQNRVGKVFVPILVLVAVIAGVIAAVASNQARPTTSTIASSTITATIPIGNQALGVAVAPDGRHAYVTTVDSDGYSAVSVIDTASKTVTTTIPLDADGARGIAITPDGHYAYVTSYDHVSVIDTASNTITTTIPVGKNSWGVAITPDGHHAYVTNWYSGDVSVIDTASNTVTTTIPVDVAPNGVAITPDGHHAVITHIAPTKLHYTVTVIDTTSNTVATTIAAGNGVRAVAITPDGRHAYVTNWYSGDVSVIDTASNTVTTTIPVGEEPNGVAITPDGHHAVITTYDPSTVSVIDTVSNTVTTTIPVGKESSGVAITPDSRYAYIAFYGSSSVSVLEIER